MFESNKFENPNSRHSGIKKKKYLEKSSFSNRINLKTPTLDTQELKKEKILKNPVFRIEQI